jgi:FAD dependent oxidoreductase TIGR03364
MSRRARSTVERRSTVGQIHVVRPLSARSSTLPPLPRKADLVVVGAGIVGLAFALEAQGRGQSVVVVERDDQPRGASVRRSGHMSVTTQDGLALAFALAARERWLKLGREAGFWVRETGAVVVARATEELAVLDDLVAARDGDATLLDADGVRARVAVTSDDVVGGAFLPLDLRIEPRDAVSALAAWFASRPAADVAWSTAVHTLEPGSGCTLVRTSRGEVVARRVVVAVGHEIDRMFPQVADDAGLRRTSRQWLRVAEMRPATAWDPAEPAVLDGTALVHHPAFAPSPALADVRERLRVRSPELVEAGVHLAFTRRADGTLVLGSARAHASPLGARTAPSPFRSEAADELLLREAGALLGARPEVVERWSVPDVEVPAWTGSHRWSKAARDRPFVVADPLPGVRSVTVTDGLGPATAFGLAPRMLDGTS